MQLNQPFRKGEIDVKRDNSRMDGTPQHLHNSFLYPPKNVLKSRVSVFLPYIFLDLQIKIPLYTWYSASTSLYFNYSFLYNFMSIYPEMSVGVLEKRMLQFCISVLKQ